MMAADYAEKKAEVYTYNRPNNRLHGNGDTGRRGTFGRVYLERDDADIRSKAPENQQDGHEPRNFARRDPREFFSPMPSSFNVQKLGSVNPVAVGFSPLPPPSVQGLSSQNSVAGDANNAVGGRKRTTGRPRFGNGASDSWTSSLCNSRASVQEPRSSVSQYSTTQSARLVPDGALRKSGAAAETDGKGSCGVLGASLSVPEYDVRGGATVLKHSFIFQGSSTELSFFGKALHKHKSLSGSKEFCAAPASAMAERFEIDDTYLFSSAGLRFRNAYNKGQTIAIYVSFVLDPSLVFVVHDEDEILYESLASLSKAMGKICPAMPILKALPPLDAVVAAFSKRYNSWFRGHVLEHVHITAKSMLVLFLDYGNAEIISLDDVRSMTAEWFRIPLSTLPVELVDFGDHGFFPEHCIKETEKLVLNKTGTLLITEVHEKHFAGELFIGEPGMEQSMAEIYQLVSRAEGIP